MKELVLIIIFATLSFAQSDPNYNQLNPSRINTSLNKEFTGNSNTFYMTRQAGEEKINSSGRQIETLSNPDYKWLHPSPFGTSLGGVKVWDANTVYAYGQAGNFVKTTDGGQTFTLNPSAGVPLGSPYNTTYDIYGAYFFDMNTFYLCGALGVTKTTDGGQTFNRVGAGTLNTGTARKIFFLDSNNGYVVGTSAIKMMRTTNGGATWIPNVFLPSATYYTLKVFTTSRIVVGGSVSSGANIRVTTDGGTTWTAVAAGANTIYSMAFTDALIGYAGSESGLAYKTTDGGLTWNQLVSMNAPGSSAFFDIFTNGSDVCFVDLDSLLFVTPDGGTSFSRINYLPPGKPNQIMRAGGAYNGNYYLVGDHGYFIKSTDNGSSWQTNSTVLASGYVQSIYANETGKIIAVGTDEPNQVLISDDYGNNFTAAGIPFTGGDLRDLSMLDENTGFAVGSSGKIYKTTNGGYNWVMYTGATSIYAFNSIDFYNSQYGMAFGNNSKTFKTTDGGINWIDVSNLGFTTTGNSIDMVDSLTAYAAASYYIFKTTDGGTTWTQHATGVTAPISCVKFTRPGTGYIVGSGPTSGAGYLFKTTDDGTTWINKNFPFSNNPIFKISFRSDDDYTLVGLNGGIFHTTDDGTTWTQLNLGLPTFMPSQVIGIAYAGQDTLIVGAPGASIVEVPLNPLAPTTFQLSVNVANGWNMTSVPGTNPDGMGVSSWWSDLTGTVYKFVPGSGYSGITTTTPGEGYWMKNNGTETYSYPAIQVVTHDPINATSGWNMFGGYENSVDPALLTTTPADQIVYPIYKFVPGSGYATATSIDPGYGYWVKVASNCQINVPGAALAKGKIQATNYFKDDLPEGKVNWGRITLTDAAGQSYTLYAVKGQVDLNKYELPPLPPAGVFDVRYSSGKAAEDINSSVQSINMTGVKYPVKVRVEGIDIRLQDATGKEISRNVKAGEEITVSNSAINKLMVSGELIPDKYSLEQNYPNPFNPSTTIEFSLPENVTNVTISIYNVLGEKVAELVNGAMQAGKYQYQWNAKNFASGMYVYELRTDKFVSVKKMLLLK